VQANYPRLAIKIPTRSRPAQFFKILDCFYQKLSGVVPYHIIVSCDEDDTTMNNQIIRAKLHNYPNLSVSFKPRISKIDAYNRDLELYDFDVLLVASDDAIPVKEGYDKIIVETMMEHFPDFDGVLNFNDGHVNSQCNTLPVLGRKFYNRFGYVYHPAYKALVCDVELTVVARALGKELISNAVIIQHEHPAFDARSLDRLYIENEKWHAVDFAVFYKRIVNRFYLLDELDALCTKTWSILLSNPQKSIKDALQKQINALELADSIEVLVDTSTMPIGYKKNLLLGQSRGYYVNFIDENISSIAPDYVQKIYQSVYQSKEDCFQILNKPWHLKHLNPIKRSIAVLITFCDTNNPNLYWSEHLRKAGLIKTEKRLDQFNLVKIT
jgi:hypothetical protein